MDMQKHFKIKKVFFGLVLTYLFTIMIPIVLAVVISITAKDISLKREVDINLASLEQGMNLFENQLLEFDKQAQQYMYHYAVDVILKQKEIEPGDKNIYSIIKFQQDLNQKFSDSLINDNYCMLLKNGMAFNSTTMCDDPEFFYKHFRSYGQLSYEQYIDRSFSSLSRVLFPMQNIYINNMPTQAITYNYPIKRSDQRNNKVADAVVQFLISKEYLQSLFASVISEENTSMFILDERSNSLANIGEYREVDLFVEGNRGYFTIDDDTMGIYIKSDKSKYSYVSVLPRKIVLSDALHLQHMLIVWIIILGTIDIGLGIFFAWKYSLPVKNLVRNIENLLAPVSDIQPGLANVDVRNEYEYLQQSFQKLIRVNKNIKVNSFYYYLFFGEFKNNKDVINEAAKFGLPLGNLRYCVACSDVADKGDAIVGCLPLGIENHVLAVQNMGRVLVILFGYALDAQDDYIYSSIEEVSARVFEQLNMPVNTGIGLIYANEREITFSYNQAGIALAASQNESTNSGMTVKYSTLPIDQSRIFYSTDMSEKLINYTRQGELENLKKILNNLEEENFEKRKLSVAMQKLLISDIVSTMLKLMNDDRSIDVVHFADEILCYSDTRWAMDKLKEKFTNLCMLYGDAKNNRRNTYQSMLHQYMEEHYMDKQLTLAQMAEEFAFSEGYFSQFFKDNTGDVFSNYLETLRIQKAKELIKHKQDTLETIALKVGYNSSGTFRRAFKRVTGVSPSVWDETNSLHGS